MYESCLPSRPPSPVPISGVHVHPQHASPPCLIDDSDEELEEGGGKDERTRRNETISVLVRKPSVPVLYVQFMCVPYSVNGCFTT